MGHDVIQRAAALLSAGSAAGAVPVSEPGSSAVNGTAAANTQVQIVIAAVTGVPLHLTHLSWSYSAAPAGGRIQVQDGATTILDLDVVNLGFDNVALPGGGERITPGNACTITLAAAGVGVIGKLNVASYSG